MNKKVEKVIMILGGGAIGFINGFFGGGGGMVCVPMLQKLLKRQTKTSHATAIAIILPISIISAITYIVGGNFDMSVTIKTGIGVLAGGVVGACLLKKLNSKLINIIFSLLMIVAGVKLAFF